MLLQHPSLYLAVFFQDGNHDELPKAFTAQKATIHQVTTMLSTSKNVLFPGHNHLLTTGTDDSTLSTDLPEHQRVKGHQYQWFAGGYHLEIVHFQKWLA